MERRTHESPMDFEWQTHGPADVTSPFYQLSQKQGQIRSFQSPAKPAIPQPDANSSLFNSAANTATPFRNPSFTTPRKPFDPDLFSETSGAESSPADNADAEDTPERVKTNTELTMVAAGLARRKPLFGRYGANFAVSTPGRGEIRRGKYPDAVIRKVRKRRRTEKEYTLVNGRPGSSDYESDFEESRPHGTKKESDKASTQSFIVSFLSFIESKPQLPSVLSYYVQFLFNAFLTCIVMYLVYNFWCTVKADIDKASATLVDELVAEMTLCARNYAENKCSPPAQRLPALGPQCDNWEMCMNQDPTKSGRSKVGAYTLAEIINNFVEPISWKAMSFILLIVMVWFMVNSFVFGVFRPRTSHPMHPPQYYAPPPPMPSHSQDYSWQIPQTPRQSSNPVSHDTYGGIAASNFQAITPSPAPGYRSPKKLGWN